MKSDATQAVSAVARVHAMPFGAAFRRGFGTRFRLWAPAHPRIALLLDGQASRGMDRREDGWHELIVAEAMAGTRYRFGLPDGTRVPDPASRFQPQDVHGPSEVVDAAAYAWTDLAWTGRPWHETVLYELHIGAFTPAGTFRSAIGKLDHLAALGVTAIEIMPVADFPGRRNWGYDGVLPYAPDSTYGRPEDFKALVEAAHARGISIILDVVYNHFGPEGNYLGAYAPDGFTNRHKTPWGDAINYDGPNSGPMREFVVHNALYWIEEFHLDGLRLDAVHAILDDSQNHLLTELCDRIRSATAGRPIHLIVEDEDNRSSHLVRARDDSPRFYTAQWNDDLHHVLHVAASGESKGYYVDYLGDTEKLGRALAEGFAFQGEIMPYRGRPRGEPSADLPPQAFVAFIQNHDQIGNRAFGDRITTFSSAAAVRAIVAIYLLLPQIPMLFMGEEWESARPFPFFCDFGTDLADAVRQGRRDEFARFPEFQDKAMRDRIPDPLAAATFAAAKLDWHVVGEPAHGEILERYRRILAVRHARIVPLAAKIGGHVGTYKILGPSAAAVRWRARDGTVLELAANLKDRIEANVPPPLGKIFWREGEISEAGLGPWAIRWSIADGGRP